MNRCRSSRTLTRGAATALLAMLISFPALAELPPAQPHSFQSMAQKAEVRLGEPFDYTIQIRHDPADQYELEGQSKSAPPGASPKGSSVAFLEIDPFEASSAHCQVESTPEKDAALTICRIRLALYDLGEHEVPGIRLLARGPAGDRVLLVPGPRVKGLGIIDPGVRTEELAIRDLAPPVPLMIRSWRLLGWFLGMLAAAGLVIAGWIGWKRWRRRSLALAEAPPLPPPVRCERRLSELAAEQLPQRGLTREFFFRLSEIVREYLGALFAINALDLTTAELMEALSRRTIPIDRVTLQRWCEQADLVKFARHLPTGEECNGAWRYARELLETTRSHFDPVPLAVKPEEGDVNHLAN